MTVVRYHERKEAIQYTGSNSAAIDALVTDFNITSETGGVLTVQSGGPTYVINTNDWVCCQQGYIMEVRTPNEFVYFYTELIQTSQVAALEARTTAAEAAVAALEARMTAAEAAAVALEARVTAAEAAIAVLQG
jgi:hypothetical protein